MFFNCSLFRCIGEYISLELFYFVILTSSCSLIHDMACLMFTSYSHTPSDCSHVYKQPYIICFLETKHVFENKANSLILTSNWVWQKVWPTCRRVMFIPWTFPSSTTPKYAVPPSPEFRKAFKFLLYIKITLCNSAALSERAKSNYLLPPK